MKGVKIKMKANKLVKGDSVGICAPSGVVSEKNIKAFEKSNDLLNYYNLTAVYSKNLLANTLQYSATPNEKSNDLNELVLDKNIKAIIFAKGGSNSNSILKLIDYDNIKNNPKIFMGFSDNTVLLNAIYKKTSLITYHFTNYKGFCEDNLDFNKKQFENVFINENRGEVLKANLWKTLRKGIAEGKLIGGNLSSFVKILNTEFCPSFYNNILFLEDLSIESNLEMISSYVYQLKNSGVFNKISGLLIGNYDTKENVTFEDVIMEAIKEYDFPVVKCNDFGHTSSNIVLPIGLKCTLDANKCKLIYNERSAK